MPGPGLVLHGAAAGLGLWPGDTAYPIAYFAQPTPWGLRRFNTWGTTNYWYDDEKGQRGWSQNHEDFEELDFDFAPWIDSGKLSWIAPGDRKLKLRDTVKDCPYLAVGGQQTFMRIQQGEVWEPEISPEQKKVFSPEA